MKSDPVTLELFKNALFSIADEMAVTICRTTYSGVLRDNMDFSTAFTDAQGKLVAQGLTIPLHLGSIPTALESVLEHFGEDIGPGDIFVMNDHVPFLRVISCPRVLQHAGRLKQALGLASKLTWKRGIGDKVRHGAHKHRACFGNGGEVESGDPRCPSDGGGRPAEFLEVELGQHAAVGEDCAR